MVEELRGSIGPRYAALYFCIDGKRVGFVPIFLLKRLRDLDLVSAIETADWFHFTDIGEREIPQDPETQERFLKCLKKNFSWETIRNLVQTCESDRVFLSWPWQEEIPCESISYQFDVLSTPPRLYRYCRYDKDRIEQLFTNNLLYFTNPGRFNDPFDCNFNEDVRLNLDQAGICCLAAQRDSVLMFSQYARRHTGLCLIFDTALLRNIQIESGDAVRERSKVPGNRNKGLILSAFTSRVSVSHQGSEKLWVTENNFLFLIQQKERFLKN